MNAKDLMIDDWVLYTDNNPYQLTDVGKNTTRIGSVYVIPEELNPLPLTKDILEKNEFEICYEYSYDSKKTYQLGDKLYIEVEGGKFSLCTEYYVCDWDCFDLAEIASISFVHELQHALKLCGIEKGIEI